jgi:hypothetical protein
MADVIGRGVRGRGLSVGWAELMLRSYMRRSHAEFPDD